ncbi:hypothetical protein [uncultured Sphingomonas sp.]|uniref:hypothetical protein n=1 Tax=uncultured Sphingomonas sp. TaxID=158754 RepID=UPI00258A3E88|nr:hypothetical protein [uncultured Sphingomonas sp.]
MTDSYLNIGTISEVPEPLKGSIRDFSIIIDEEPRYYPVMALAGPNDVFYLLMGSTGWALAWPWVEQFLKGAVGFLGGQAAAKIVKSKLEKKMDLQDSAIAELSAKFDSLLNSIENTTTSWEAPWELHIGLKATDAEESRELIGQIVENREDVAAAVLSMILIGECIEDYRNAYKKEFPDSDESAMHGTTELMTDGTVKASLQASGPSYTIRNTEITRFPNGYTTISEPWRNSEK